MLDNPTREAIALKKFSLISPVLNGQVKNQSERIKLFKNPAVLDEYFLLKVTRKVKHDAALSLDNILFETEQKLANSRVEVRYDPEWLSNPNTPILLYHEGKKIGESRQVNFHDNAHVKRKGPGRPETKHNESPLKMLRNLHLLQLIKYHLPTS